MIFDRNKFETILSLRVLGKKTQKNDFALNKIPHLSAFFKQLYFYKQTKINL